MTKALKSNNKKRLILRLFEVLLMTFTILQLATAKVFAASSIDVVINGEGSDTVRIIVLLTIIAVSPFLLLMCTCFGRIVIVLSFLRNALGTQQAPPNQVLVGLALFITLFIMQPTFADIYENAFVPYDQGLLETTDFIEASCEPLKEFMLKQCTTEDVDLFVGLNHDESVAQLSGTQLPMHVVVPAFITSELKRAFVAGFLIYIPFVLIDLVVASVTMSMGMIMLPPTMISLPFKLMLFIVVDGWGLLVETLVQTYH
jgi:flagellar biosynthetic protein FliP